MEIAAIISSKKGDYSFMSEHDKTTLDIINSATAFYNVAIARQYGVPAAVLLNKIITLCQYTQRKDGFCWFTAPQFEAVSGFKKTCYHNAVKTLVEAGIIEKKVTYILGTMERANHFRLLTRKVEIVNTESSLYEPSRTSAKCDFREYREDREYISNSTNLSFQQSEAQLATQASLQPDSASPRQAESVGSNPLVEGSASPSQDKVSETTAGSETIPQSTSRLDKTTNPFPSEEETASVSIRPDKVRNVNPEDSKRRRNFHVLQAMYKYFGWRGKPTAVEAKLIGNALDSGWQPQEIGEMLEWQEKDEFYSQASICAKLSDNAFKKYDMATRKRRNTPPGIVPDDTPYGY